MATVLRLARAGAKKAPVYHLVAADSRFARDGRFIEKLGTYNPRTEPEMLQLDGDRLEHWLKVGARPSERVARLIKTWKQRQSAES
jgi:small subunit ribosomal protein S16